MLVAYSGGTDSTLLATLAGEILGGRALAVTARSPLFTDADMEQAEAVARHIGIRHLVIATEQLSDPLFVANDARRCYHCKRRLFQRLQQIAADSGLAAVADGTNHDDLSDTRPGMQAAVELGVASPLLDAGLTKSEIRHISRQRGLPN